MYCNFVDTISTEQPQRTSRRAINPERSDVGARSKRVHFLDAKGGIYDPSLAIFLAAAPILRNKEPSAWRHTQYVRCRTNNQHRHKLRIISASQHYSTITSLRSVPIILHSSHCNFQYAQQDPDPILFLGRFTHPQQDQKGL